MPFIIGKKLEMTKMFDQKGKATPVTLIEALPCLVSAIRTGKKHGYWAVQIKFSKKDGGEVKSKETHPRKDDFRFYREFRVEDKKAADSYKIGDNIEPSVFKAGDLVKVRGISKGKGFQGVVKRWGFAGSPASHGHRHDTRAPGSIGSAFPQKVFRGLKMAGRMGAKRTTVKGLKVIVVDPKKNLIALRGAVPGIPGGTLEIRGD